VAGYQPGRGAALQLADALQQLAGELLTLATVEPAAQLRDQQRLAVPRVLAEDLQQHPDLGVEAPVGGDHAAQLDHDRIQQMVLLELPLDLLVVAGGVGAQRRVQQLVLARDVGCQRGPDGPDGLMLLGVAALGLLVEANCRSMRAWTATSMLAASTAASTAQAPAC
jgi:hypothetical protein